MRAIPADELARILAETGHWRYRVEAQRPGDAAWTNLSDGQHGDWTLAIESDGETPDSPATGVTVRFLARDGADALSPGMSQSAFNRVAGLLRPLLYPGRRVRIFAANVAAPADAPVWRPWWTLVEVEDLEVVPGEVVAKCQTLDAKLEATWMTVEEEGGSPDPGRPVEDEIRSVLERWAPWALPLRVVGTPDWSVGPYPRGKTSVGQLVRSLAQRNAWDLRWRWSEADGAHVLTLYLPPRDKAEPDLVLHASQVHESPLVSMSRRDVRNDFTTDYRDENGVGRSARLENGTEGPPPEGSIGDYGRRAMVLDETGPESPIRSAAQADALLAYADHDLSEPLTDRTVVLPFLPWLELHDLLEVAADGVEYDFPGRWAVTSVSHRVTATEGASTEVGLRGGSPVGMYYAWLARGGAQVPAPDTEPLIRNVRPISRVGRNITYGFDVHPDVVTAPFWKDVRTVPYTTSPWPVAGEPPDPPAVDVLEVREFTVFWPYEGEVALMQLQAHTADGRGDVWQFEAYGVGVPGDEGDDWLVGTVTWAITFLPEGGGVGGLRITLNDPLGLVAALDFERTWWDGAVRHDDVQTSQPAGSAVADVLWGALKKAASCTVPATNEKHRSRIEPVIRLTLLDADAQPVVLRPGAELFDPGPEPNIDRITASGYRPANPDATPPTPAYQLYDILGDSDCASLWRRRVATGPDGEEPVTGGAEQIAPTAENARGNRALRVPFAITPGATDLWEVWGENGALVGPADRLAVYDRLTLPPWNPGGTPPKPPKPAGIAVTTVQAGDCATSAWLRHRITWDGEGQLDRLARWDGAQWVAVGISTAGDVELDALGGGWVQDDAGGILAPIWYRLLRQGAGSQASATEFCVWQTVRHCAGTASPPAPPPATVRVEHAADGDCAAAASLRHRVLWDGEGEVYWSPQPEAGAWPWHRPEGAGAYPDTSPVELDALGGGWVLDEAGGTERLIAYKVVRKGAGDVTVESTGSIRQKVRKCDSTPPAPDATITLEASHRFPSACTVEDVAIWSVDGWDGAAHRLEYQMLNGYGTPTSGWSATAAQAAAGSLSADVHAGQKSFKLMPDAEGEELVDYGVALRVVRQSTGAEIASAAVQWRYVVAPCSRGGTGGGGGGGGGGPIVEDPV